MHERQLSLSILCLLVFTGFCRSFFHPLKDKHELCFSVKIELSNERTKFVQPVVTRFTNTYSWVAMSSHIHLRERAHVAHSCHFHSEVSEEIHDVQGFRADFEHQYEWCYDRADQLFQQVNLRMKTIC